MSNLECRTLLVVLALFSAATTLSPAQNRRVEIRVGKAGQAMQPQPRAGDVLRVDENGDVVIESKDVSGEVESHRIPRRTKVVPDIAAEVHIVGPDRVRYSYMVGNGAAARQNIVTVSIGASRLDLILDESAPRNWRAVGPSRGSTSFYMWGSLDRFADIAPGRAAGPFELESPLLPGLTKAYLEGYLPDEEVSIDHGWNLSPWLYARLEEALSFDNNTVQPVIVGPKLEIGSPRTADALAAAVAKEFLQASQMPDFQDHRAFLENTASYLEGAGKAAAGLRGQLNEMGGTSLQKSFFRAMALNLECLEKLP